MLRRVRELVRRFHNEVAGQIPVEMVMAIGLAALICFGIAKVVGVDTGGNVTGGAISGVAELIKAKVGIDVKL